MAEENSIYIGRQPILDKNYNIVAYELLFRSSEKNYFPGIEDFTATAHVVYSVLSSVNFECLAGSKKVFINFSRDLLIEGIPELLPPSKVVIEILEDVELDEDLIEACKTLVRQGYSLALDDFFIKPGIEQLLKISSIIKVDWRATDVNEIKLLLEKLRFFKHLKFLAEKVETLKEVKIAQDFGFDYYQGYFFYKPEVIRSKEASVNRWTYIELLEQLQKPDIEWADLERIISKDAVLSYKLLRFVNSPHIGLRNKISSLKQACIILGIKRIKKWLSMMLLAQATGDNNSIILINAFIRAKFCEGIGSLVYEDNELADMLFLTGLLSLLDIIFGSPMEELLGPLHLDNRVSECLLKRKGPLAPFLVMAIAYEKGNFDLVNKLAKHFSISSESITSCYLEAIKEAQAILEQDL